jgi:hypothetical protein
MLSLHLLMIELNNVDGASPGHSFYFRTIFYFFCGVCVGGGGGGGGVCGQIFCFFVAPRDERFENSESD